MNFETIQAKLIELGNEEIASHSQRFFKTGKGEYGEGDQFLGVRVPVVRKVAQEFKKTSFEVICRLLTSEFHEIRLLALIMLVNAFKRGNEDERQAIYDHYLNSTRFINNWDLVDTSAGHIVGAFLFEKDRSPLYQLVLSNDLWERRISIISTFYFIGKNQFDDTLSISEKLLKDQEDLIHKAVGWMLREVGKRDQETEEQFLKQHYQNMPRTMLRYSIEKFPEKLRQSYLKGNV